MELVGTAIPSMGYYGFGGIFPSQQNATRTIQATKASIILPRNELLVPIRKGDDLVVFVPYDLVVQVLSHRGLDSTFCWNIPTKTRGETCYEMEHSSQKRTHYKGSFVGRRYSRCQTKKARCTSYHSYQVNGKYAAPIRLESNCNAIGEGERESSHQGLFVSLLSNVDLCKTSLILLIWAWQDFNCFNPFVFPL